MLYREIRISLEGDANARVAATLNAQLVGIPDALAENSCERR